MNTVAQQRAYSLKEASALCGCSYHSLWRRVVTGEIRVLSGFGRIKISDRELDRFLDKAAVYQPTKRGAK
jgi:hypothetical protein